MIMWETAENQKRIEFTNQTWEAIWGMKCKASKCHRKERHGKFTRKPHIKTSVIKHQMVWEKWHSFVIQPQISWGLWNRQAWWGRWALDCRHAGLCTVAIQKRLHSSAAEGCPFPQGSWTENGSCHTGIVLVWSHLCGDSWPREGIRRQGGSIWVMLQQAEASRSMILIHTDAYIHAHAYIFHKHPETYTVEIPDIKQYGILKSDTNNVRIMLQWLMLLFVHICYL